MALASKSGFGSKEADREINKIAREADREREEGDRVEQLVSGETKVHVPNTIGEKFDLKKLGMVKLDGRDKHKRTNNPGVSR